jgi:alpha-D-ribose 1-methylphosphonate 5-triphosphate synthase subunit PhnI
MPATKHPLEGRKVRHKKTRLIRRIAAVYTDIEGGVKLDKPVEGFVSWNLADLKLLR